MSKLTANGHIEWWHWVILYFAATGVMFHFVLLWSLTVRWLVNI